jgi:hypothetical protein
MDYGKPPTFETAALDISLLQRDARSQLLDAISSVRLGVILSSAALVAMVLLSPDCWHEGAVY